MESGLLFLMVLTLLFIGVPVGIALGLSSILFITFFSNDSLSSVAIQLFGAGQHYTLLAIPFFILASVFMSTGGVAKRLINFCDCQCWPLSWRSGHGLGIGLYDVCRAFRFLSGHRGCHRYNSYRGYDAGGIQ